MLVGIVLGSLALSLFCFSPHLWVMFGPPNPATTIWARGLQFSLQCEHPLRSDLLDAGLVWRLAPAVLGHLLHLRGTASFIIPWAGLILLLFLSARLAWRLTRDPLSTWLCTSLIGTTSAVFTVTGWLGFNDAWYACALLVVAFQPQFMLVAAAAFIGPWIDERFVLALPLACWVHAHQFGSGRLKQLLGLAAAGVTLYLGFRLAAPLGQSSQRVTGYLSGSIAHFYEWLPWVPLGWFMGLRAAWLLALAPLVTALESRRYAQAGWLAAVMAAPLGVITMLAADTSRTPTMLLPLVFLGLAQTATRWGPAILRRILAGLLIANLLMPAMHVTYKYPDIVNMLPVEIARLIVR